MAVAYSLSTFSPNPPKRRGDAGKTGNDGGWGRDGSGLVPINVAGGVLQQSCGAPMATHRGGAG